MVFAIYSVFVRMIQITKYGSEMVGRKAKGVPSVETQHYRAHMIKFPSRELNKAGVKRVEDLVVFFCFENFFGIFLLLGTVLDVSVNVLASLQLLFKLDQVVDTVDDHLDQLELGEAEAVSVGDVEHATLGGSVNTT